MNLKAALQNVALDTGTVGWAILERLIGEGEAPHTAAEWTEIWEVITSGKVCVVCCLSYKDTWKIMYLAGNAAIALRTSIRP